MSKAVGVYIGRNVVVAVSAVRSMSGPQIKNFAIEPIQTEGWSESSIEKEARNKKKLSPAARAIFGALDKIHAPGAFVNVAVSPIQVVTRHFVMPSVPKKEEAGAVHHEASRYIPFKISDSVMDYHARSTHKNVCEITATAIRAEILETYLEDLRSASAKTLMVEPVFTAVGRAFGALNMLGKSKSHGFLVLQSDGNVNVTLAFQGVVYLSRDFLLTGKLEEDKGRFYEELKASIDFFYKLTGGEVIEQIFLSGVGDLHAWSEHFERVFNPTIRFYVANSTGLKNIPQETLSVVLTAFGLSLRSLGYPSPVGDIKLLPVENRRSRPLQFLAFLGMECLAILIFFAFLRLAVLQPYIMHLKSQAEVILGPVKQEDPSFAFLSGMDLVKKKKLAEARLKKLQDFFSDQVPASVFLRAFGQGLPQSILLDSISCETAAKKGNAVGLKANRRLNVTGLCYLGNAEKETEIISGWVKSLSLKKIVADYFSEIKLDEVKREKVQGRDLTRFRVVGE